jgi:hypothetical protein
LTVNAQPRWLFDWQEHTAMYALVAGGWKMTMHTGVLRYE